ncbi:MAG: hypothetical protein NT075_16705 [Chloroflexi bacterium]|nr:hypothetical protein [Chloroflexota bacterium]
MTTSKDRQVQQINPELLGALRRGYNRKGLNICAVSLKAVLQSVLNRK